MQSSDTLEFKTYKVGDNKQNVRKQISNGNQGLTAAPRVHNEYIEAEHTWYEEIAGVVSNDDDPNMLCSTFRVWFIGLFFVVSFTVVNTYFHYRMKRIVLDGSHIFLLSFVLGKFLAFVLPKKSFRLWPNTNYCFSFNPGPFTIKEHVLIVAMANLSNTSYALNPIDVQKVYYKKSIHPILTFGFILSSQLIGYGIAALLVHTILYHGKDILKQFRTSLQNRDNDIHCRLMARYDETPEWWFTILFILPMVISMVVCYFSELLSWYYLLIAIPIGLVRILPLGILGGSTGINP
ncbi:unnamed protein product [Rotaria sp. Silwood1]|nr:unnamed protein product [Rotaria sp. Silwood1]